MDDAAIHALNEALKCLHDGLVKGLWVSEDRSSVTFLVRGYDNGPLYEIRCDGLEWLRIDDFRQGNIILGVELIRVSKLQKQHLDTISGDREIESCLKLGLSREPYDRQHEAWIQKDLLNLSIAPSYGCWADAVCRSVSFKKCDHRSDGGPPAQRS